VATVDRRMGAGDAGGWTAPDTAVPPPTPGVATSIAPDVARGPGPASGPASGTASGTGSGLRTSTSGSSTPTTGTIRPGRADRRTTAAQPPPSAAALHGPLRVNGNRIVDADGRPVVLRGVNRVGMETPGVLPPITDGEIAQAKAWDVNVVRVPLGEAFINAACPGQYIPTYYGDIDTTVQSITSRGMVALLDLHTGTRVPCGESQRWKMADKPSSIDFWHAVAARYKDNPLVAFDLYNEPHDISPDEWRNGGETTDIAPTGFFRWTMAGMQDLYDAVRSTGATNLVTISGMGWGGNPTPILDGHEITGTNIVYAAHVYTCSAPNQWCTSSPNTQTADINSLWKQVAARYPVMVTEFGWPDQSKGTYNASVIRAAQAQDPPWGWIAFAWNGRTTGAFGLVADLATYAPTPSGVPVKTALASAP
jgi:endoglucanase